MIRTENHTRDTSEVVQAEQQPGCGMGTYVSHVEWSARARSSGSSTMSLDIVEACNHRVSTSSIVYVCTMMLLTRAVKRSFLLVAMRDHVRLRASGKGRASRALLGVRLHGGCWVHGRGLGSGTSHGWVWCGDGQACKGEDEGDGELHCC